MSGEESDLELGEAWDALVKAGARVYLLCEEGVSTGTEVVYLGRRHAITVDDMDGYQVVERDDEYWELVPRDGYDDEAAVRAASDLEGYFGVVDIPGSHHHDYEWCETEEDARRWIEEAHPSATRYDVMTASEAFDVRYLDGSRVYFRRRQVGPGFEPKAGP